MNDTQSIVERWIEVLPSSVIDTKTLVTLPLGKVMYL